MIVQTKTFLVINPNQGTWGKAADLKTALQNCKSNEGSRGPRVRHTYDVLAFNAEPSKVTIEAGVSLIWNAPESVPPDEDNLSGVSVVMRFQWVA